MTEDRNKELKAMGNKRVFRRKDVIKHKILLKDNVWYVYSNTITDLKNGYLENELTMKKGVKLKNDNHNYYYPVWEDLV